MQDWSPGGHRTPRGRYTPTTSGDATLCQLDEETARYLSRGDLLVTPWPTGWLPLVVEGVRESAGGDDEGRPVPCLVVDARPPFGWLPDRALAFAPADLLRAEVLS